MGEDAVKAALANAGKQVDAIAASATEIALSAAAA